MLLLQIVITLAVLFAISRVLLLLKKRQISVYMSIFWIALWLCALIAIYIPQTISRASDLFGIQRGADMLIYASILLLFYLIFRTNAKIDNTEKKITEIVRQQALKNEKK